MYIFVENLYTMKRTTLILTCVAGLVLFAGGGNGGGNKSGKNDVKLGYSVKMYKGLQKSMEETMKDAAK